MKAKEHEEMTEGPISPGFLQETPRLAQDEQLLQRQQMLQDKEVPVS